VARDRQRAKQRRRRQGQAPGGGPNRQRPRERDDAARDDRDDAAREMGLDDAGVDEAGLGEAPPEPEPEPGPGSPSVFPSLGHPDSLEHASGFADEARAAEAGAPLPPEDVENLEDDDFESAPDEVEGDLVPTRVDPAVAEDADEQRKARDRGRPRVIVFLGHVWDELRRVQWPDRRQVGQATAVVLGFIVIAGGYLGLLDALWKPLIDAIL
jgi:preprotein translocase SecE subunit